MPRYLLSVHSVDGEASQPLSDELMEQFMRSVRELEQEMTAANALVYSGRLADIEAATVVRVERGENLITDGPFAEAKEHLGGFYIIEAEDLDSAVSWAAKVTQIVGAPIEVRPLWDEDGG